MPSPPPNGRSSTVLCRSRRPIPQIVNADPDQPGLFRPGHHPVLERPGEKLRKNREHMKRHDRFKSFKPSGNSTSIRRAAVSIDYADRPRERDQQIRPHLQQTRRLRRPPNRSLRPATRPSRARSPHSRSDRSGKTRPAPASAARPCGIRTSAPRQGSASSIESMP